MRESEDALSEDARPKDVLPKDVRKDDEDLPRDAAGLEKRLRELEEEMRACQERIKDWSAREDFRQGIFFPTEIHAARQHKLILEYKKQVCRNRINRLRQPDRAD